MDFHKKIIYLFLIASAQVNYGMILPGILKNGGLSFVGLAAFGLYKSKQAQKDNPQFDAWVNDFFEEKDRTLKIYEKLTIQKKQYERELRIDKKGTLLLGEQQFDSFMHALREILQKKRSVDCVFDDLATKVEFANDPTKWFVKSVFDDCSNAAHGKIEYEKGKRVGYQSSFLLYVSVGAFALNLIQHAFYFYKYYSVYLSRQK